MIWKETQLQKGQMLIDFSLLPERHWMHKLVLLKWFEWTILALQHQYNEKPVRCGGAGSLHSSTQSWSIRTPILRGVQVSHAICPVLAGHQTFGAARFAKIPCQGLAQVKCHWPYATAAVSSCIEADTFANGLRCSKQISNPELL